MTAVHDDWYVQIEGQVYGPYTHALMRDYVQEGRILPESQITADPSQGFVAARRYPQFNEWNEVHAEPQKIAVGSDVGAVTAQPFQPQISQPTQTTAQQPVHTPYAPAVLQPAQPRQLQPQRGQQSPSQTPSHASVLLVMAEIRSGQTMGFLQTLQNFGPAQRIGDTVWLVRSQANVQAVRNALSQTLTRQDRLFVMDSFANETAWFNIGADMDARIRQLWAGGHGAA